jgi:hypothetical protein
LGLWVLMLFGLGLSLILGRVMVVVVRIIRGEG